MSCEYCNRTDGGFNDLNTTMMYSGIEIAISAIGALRCRHYPTRRYTDGYEMQDVINISFCPMCGEPLTEIEPLTLEQLREMDGQPVWIKEIEEWAIVTVDKVGMWKDRPFVLGKCFEYDVAKRKLTCYPRKPREG